MVFIRNGSTSSNFHIAHPSVAGKIVSWIDLNKVFFHHLLQSTVGTSSVQGYARFRQFLALRRSYHPVGSGLYGATSAGLYNNNSFNYTNYIVSAYSGVGNLSSSTSNFNGAGNYDPAYELPPIGLPVAFSNNNPAYAANVTPIFTGAQYSQYLLKGLPDDFGISMHYANNTMALQDRLVVSSGVEEWEMINVANNATITTGASPMFLARVV